MDSTVQPLLSTGGNKSYIITKKIFHKFSNWFHFYNWRCCIYRKNIRRLGGTHKSDTRDCNNNNDYSIFVLIHNTVYVISI
jgi:hypothetical protein